MMQTRISKNHNSIVFWLVFKYGSNPLLLFPLFEMNYTM